MYIHLVSIYILLQYNEHLELENYLHLKTMQFICLYTLKLFKIHESC